MPVALVTGASRGIGRAAALALGRRGYDVAVHYRASEPEAEEVAAGLRQTGLKSDVYRADFSDLEAVAGLCDAVERSLGPIDVLVNNVGGIRDKLVLTMSEADWDDIWNANLAGSRLLSRTALRSMAARRGGRIVNIGTVVALTGNAGQANYVTAKSALYGLTLALAVQAAPLGVTVNCVIPGYITTDATSHIEGERKDEWLERIPMRRAATPEVVAEAICFFTEPAADYITGQLLSVDGGLAASWANPAVAAPS